MHRTPNQGGVCETGSAGAACRPPGAVFLKKSNFGPFWASGVVRMGPDRRYDSFGLCLGTNRRFSTQFGPNLMFLAPTGTLVSQDLGLACLWASLIAAGKPNPLSGPIGDFDICLVSTEGCQQALSFCVFELATPYSAAEWRRSVSL